MTIQCRTCERVIRGNAAREVILPDGSVEATCRKCQSIWDHCDRDARTANPDVTLRSRVRLRDDPMGHNGQGTVIKLDRYPYGARRAYVLWDDVPEDHMGLGVGILTHRTTSLEVVQ